MIHILIAATPQLVSAITCSVTSWSHTSCFVTSSIFNYFGAWFPRQHERVLFVSFIYFLIIWPTYAHQTVSYRTFGSFKLFLFQTRWRPIPWAIVSGYQQEGIWRKPKCWFISKIFVMIKSKKTAHNFQQYSKFDNCEDLFSIELILNINI